MRKYEYILIEALLYKNVGFSVGLELQVSKY